MFAFVNQGKQLSDWIKKKNNTKLVVVFWKHSLRLLMRIEPVYAHVCMCVYFCVECRDSC